MSILLATDPWDAAVKIATIASTVLLAWLSYKTNKNAAEAKQRFDMASAERKEDSDAIKLLEKNTNSIKDALVKVTGEKAHAEGVLEGKAEAKGQVGEKSVDVETQIVKKQIVEKQEKP